ncbi:MAG: NUDIX hydrolase [bacterium]|nr:NUDIX hydrolase [bacterium]
MDMKTGAVLADPLGGVAVGLVIDSDTGRHILIKDIRSRKNKAKMPGGRIRNDESPKEAFIREVMEKTGLILDRTKVIFLFRVLAKDETHYYHVHAALTEGLGTLRNSPAKKGNNNFHPFVVDRQMPNRGIICGHKKIYRAAIEAISSS